MPKSTRFERQYSQKETAKILRRAAEIQSRQSLSAGTGDGVSSGELVRIGEEVGLDSASIRAAMDAFEDDGDEVQTRWLGAPPSYEAERILEGSLSEYQWQALVGELNSSFQQSIEGVVSGPVRTWHWQHTYGSVHFSATQTAGSVRLKTVAYIDDGISTGMVPTIIVMIAGSAGVWSVDSFRPWLSLLCSLLFIAGIGSWFRKVVSNWYRRDRRKMQKLMDRLEETLREHGSLEVQVPSTVETAPETLEQRLSQG